jgi:CubicO group peptidase (beta-lactamase class C family)
LKLVAGTRDVAELKDAAVRALQTWLPEQLNRFKIPGASVGVTTRDELVWEAAYGRCERGGRAEVNSNTLFCVRSLTKSITALGVLVAVQRGLLDLDVPVVRYAPGCLPQTRYRDEPEQRVTLRHLLANRAGFTHDEPPGNENAEAPGHFNRRIAAISRSWFRFPVGLRYAYSNLHFDLAGHILQAVTGMPFAEYMTEAVLTPLGMHDTTFDWRQAEESSNLARGYAPDGTQETIAIPEGPSAGVYSNVPDMARFARFHLNGSSIDGPPPIGKDLMDAYRTVQFPEPGQQTGYCLGMVRQLVGNTYSLSHSGGGHGYQAQQIIYPELGFAVGLLTYLDGHGLTVGPLQRVLDDVIRNRYGPEPIFDARLDTMASVANDDPRVAAILGRYWEGGDWIVDQEKGSTTLHTGSGKAEPLSLYEDGGTLVSMHGETELLRFTPGERGAPPMLHCIDLRLQNRTYRVRNGGANDLEGPNREDWSRFCGHYEILWQSKPIDTVNVHIHNGYLYFDDRKSTEYEPSLFFTCDGEAIDFRGPVLTAANMILRRR